MARLAGFDKEALRRELLALLTEQHRAAKAAYQAAVDGAFHDEAKPENDKDTRGTELSYLARGQAKRVEELEVALAQVGRMDLRAFDEDSAISASAIVKVAYANTGDAAAKSYFIAPHGGGLVLTDGLIVVTPASPLGRRLCGKRQGDATDEDDTSQLYGDIVAVA